MGDKYQIFLPYRRYLAQFGPLADAEFGLICEHARLLRLKKGAHFLEEGKTCREIAFILSGVMRTGSYAGEREMTCYFMKENQFTGGYDSLTSGKPSPYFVQALTPCDLMVFTQNNLRQILESVPKMALWAEKITIAELNDKVNQRAQINNNLDATELYDYFEREHADILLRVPLTYIAAYLGITPQSFSRLRRSRQRS